MTRLRILLFRAWALLRARRMDRDIDDEIASHLAEATDEYIRQGLSPDDARMAALRSFGGVTQTKEVYREVRSFTLLEDLRWDLRHALRRLRRAPASTAVALLTLALGIGANTAIFSIVNGVLLRPLDYPRPEQLMHLTTQFPALGSTRVALSPPEYFELRELNRSFSNVGAYRTREVNLTEGDSPRRLRAAFVDSRLLDVLGVPPEHGRVFTVSETDIPGPPPAPGQGPALYTPVAILSHELWQTAFGGRPVIGGKVEIDGRRHEIVGVMPAGLDLADNRTQIWLPLRQNPANRLNRAFHIFYAIGRLKNGVTARMAEADLNDLMSNWGERVGVSSSDHVFRLTPPGPHLLQMKPLQDEIVGGARRSIWALQAAVGFVLLITCANLANLLLARAETRRGELAVLTALGASRGRLLRQFMTEGVLLSLGGGLLGVWLAREGMQALIRAFPDSLPRTSRIDIDPLVLLVTFAVATATGLLFGLAPVLHTGAAGLLTALKEGGARGATSRLRHVRNGLVIAEVAAAVVLAVGAGLLVRTVYNLVQVDAGFDRARLVTFAIAIPHPGVQYNNVAARARIFEDVLGGLRGLPGVHAVTAMSGLPPKRPADTFDFEIANDSPSPDGPATKTDYFQAVMSDYFGTMGIPIVQGRGFQPADAASPALVAVVNETFAKTFWKGQNPIGQRVRSGGARGTWLTVVGVAKDVKQGGVDQKTGTEIYGLIEQMGRLDPRVVSLPFSNVPFIINFVLRSSLPPAALSQAIERVVHEADGTLPVVGLRDMDAVFAESIRRPTLTAQLIWLFAALALLLAAIGTYGVLSVLVAERRHEIGIRMALGADRSRVLAGIMRHGLLLTGTGVVIGLAGAVGLSRLIGSLLFGVSPADAVTMIGVVALVTLVAAVACLRPALRASRLDPNVVLRVG
jgi:predicted permease